MPRLVPVSQWGTRSIFGEFSRQIYRAFDEGVVFFAPTIGCLWVREIGNVEQHRPQRGRNGLILCRGTDFFGSEFAAARHCGFCGLNLARLAVLTNHLAEIVDLTTEIIPTGGDLSKFLVEGARVCQLFENFWVSPPGQRGTHPLEIGTE